MPTIVSVLWELLRYDLTAGIAGFNRVHGGLRRLATRATRQFPIDEHSICAVVERAMCFYWKPVRCLEKAVVTARLLRKSGIAARVVIGYRPLPFLSHAWVEVDGRVVGDSSAERDHMHILEVI